MLELNGLTRRYGDLVALDDLSFTVAEGQMFGFVGPNGAGKTTAMRIVLGVLEPDAGEVLWRSRPMDDEVRRRIGYMPEERGLYQKMRVRDQLEYFAQLHGLSPKDARDSTVVARVDEGGEVGHGSIWAAWAGVSWSMASQKRRWSSAAVGTLVKRSAAVVCHQSAKASLEHGATTRLAVASAR